nr:hypothetical protein BaRGS_032771 [Batillaria attramentaria]
MRRSVALIILMTNDAKSIGGMASPGLYVGRGFLGDPVGSKAYQLLKKPINIDEFSAMVYRDSLAVQVGLRFLTHTQAVISVQRNVTVKVKATTQPLLSVSACLIERGPKAVEDRPPLVATFLLEIMGSTDPREGGSTRVSRLATYVIKCIETEANVEPFPDKFGAWGLEYPVAAECGLKKVKDAPFLFTAKDGQVQIPIPHDGCTKMITSLCHAEDTETDLKQYTFVEMSEERATVRVRLPRPGYYKLSLFASNPEQKSCPLVGDLLIHADKGCGDLQPFPVTYSFACEIRARLLQPLVGQVKRGQATLYRLLAPSLAKAMVAKKMMEMKNDGAWEAEVVADKGLDKVGIFGSVDKNDSSLSGLYEFDVVAG